MFCGNCGKELSNDTKFCSGCGTQINIETQLSNNNQNLYNMNNQDSHQNVDYAILVAGRKTNAALLGIIFGVVGAHKAYLGKSSILYLLFCWSGITLFIGACQGGAILGMSDEDFYYTYIKNREHKISGGAAIRNIVIGAILTIMGVGVTGIFSYL